MRRREQAKKIKASLPRLYLVRITRTRTVTTSGTSTCAVEAEDNQTIGSDTQANFMLPGRLSQAEFHRKEAQEEQISVVLLVLPCGLHP